MYTLTNQGETPVVGETPTLVYINGIPYWQASGRTFPQVAGGEDPPSGANTDSNDGDDDDFDKDRALRTIKKQREDVKAAKDEAKALKERLDKLEADQRKRDDADKSEAEKAVARLAEMTKAHEEAQQKAAAAQEKLRQVQLDRAIEHAAQKHNARNPSVVARLLDRDALEFDDDGTPSNAESLVKKLLHDEPYLVGTGNSGGGSSSGVPATPRAGAPAGHDDRVKENRDKLIATGEYAPL